jgi:hypothetical protein
VGEIVPHAAPEHPFPETVHEIVEFGLEFGMGVSVAVKLAVAPPFTDDGPEIANVNRLVIVTGTVAVLLGSATLRAVILTRAGVGSTPGAV